MQLVVIIHGENLNNIMPKKNNFELVWEQAKGGACMSALVKLWKDMTINFNESPVEKNVKSFFRKLF